VGPLPKSKLGYHQYILVVSDYATRYFEEFPIRKSTAPIVAKKFVELASVIKLRHHKYVESECEHKFTGTITI